MASGIKLTQQEFLDRAQKANPNLDFSKAVYKNKKSKIIVTCSIHGDFEVLAGSCFKKLTCPKCNLEQRKQDFIKKATDIHNGKYDYSKVIYITGKKPVEIICPIHGSFFQCPSDHLKGWGCSKCSGKHKPTTKEWVDSVKNLYNGKYDLSKVEYVDNKTPVTVICPEHGKFYPIPNNYRKGVSGCPKCNDVKKHERYSKTTEQFIEEAKIIHGSKYDYSKVEYVSKDKPVTIICQKHGAFKQRPSIHLSGSNCPICMIEQKAESQRIGYDTFINRANAIHENFYDYSKSSFINTDDKTCIICPEHGKFWQVVANHLRGGGCPQCRNKNQSKLYRKLIDKFPDILIEYEKHLPWLGLQSLDIYVPKYNIGVEYDGLQHYESVECFGGEKTFLATVERDKRKDLLCKENNCKLFRIKYDYTDSDFDELIRNIQNIINDEINENKG